MAAMGFPVDFNTTQVATIFITTSYVIYLISQCCSVDVCLLGKKESKGCESVCSSSEEQTCFPTVHE